jgi:hypothetical protein
MRRLYFVLAVVGLLVSLSFTAPAYASHQWTLDSISCSNGSIEFVATNDGGSSPAVGFYIYVDGIFQFVYAPYDDSVMIPAGPYTFTLTDAAFVEGAVVEVSTGGTPISATCGATAFAGPGLPATRNLVLINRSTAVLDKPAGEPLGIGVYACQTVFITEVDGAYGNAFMMGGWIPLSATVDVPEDYGQPGGAPIRADCVGK